MYKYLLAGLLAWIGCAAAARAQGLLGSPVPAELNYEQSVVASGADCRDCKPRSNHPVLGFVARTALSPIRAAAGHLMPAKPVDDIPTKQEVARMIADGGYSPAQITAAKIKIEAAQFNARRAAVRYLASVDCQYYPEAEAGLIAALRADRAESVRFEAAVALGQSQTLTDKMLEALNMTALGLELDGNPAETSERVRTAASTSLYQCMLRGQCLAPIATEQLSARPIYPQPIAYSLPPMMPTTPPFANPVTPVTPVDRARAETVSAPPKVLRSRPLFSGWLQSPPASAISAGDPRLRGLTPIGSDLAMPSRP